jgi:hypothetical protein
MTMPALAVCAWCSTPLVQPGRGRPRRYCSDRCRYAARDDRHREVRRRSSLARLPVCGYCGARLPERRPGRGGQRRYCDEDCRRAAADDRAAGRAPSWQERGELASVPKDPLTRQYQTLHAVAETFAGAPAAAPEAQLEAALVELHTMRFTLRRLAPEVTKNLRWRVEVLAEALDAGMRRGFAELHAPGEALDNPEEGT